MISNPDIIRALNDLRGRDGIILPAQVVEAARDADSPLHDHFEWDDTDAAEKYRIDQARYLLRVTVLVLPGTVKQTHAFVSLSTETGYRSMNDVVVNVKHRNQLVLDAQRDLQIFAARYESLAEVRDLLTVIRAALKKMRAA